jgi:hypothetical protein
MKGEKNMKKLALLVVVVALAVLSCGTLSDILSQNIGDKVSSGTTNAAAPMEFKSGDILCCTESDTMIGNTFYVAKILNAGSALTKNQSEVLWMDGSKGWANFTMESRKSVNSDFKVGAYILYPAGWDGYDSMSQDDYRRTGWIMGRVTDTSDMFKKMVEVDGNKFYISVLRTPTGTVK